MLVWTDYLWYRAKSPVWTEIISVFLKARMHKAEDSTLFTAIIKTWEKLFFFLRMVVISPVRFQRCVGLQSGHTATVLFILHLNFSPVHTIYTMITFTYSWKAIFTVPLPVVITAAITAVIITTLPASTFTSACGFPFRKQPFSRFRR